MFKIKTAPTVEPIALLEAQEHLRIDADDDAGLITRLIAAAREFCEDFQGRSYLTQTIELWLDDWPDVISLPKPPVQEPSVTAGSFVTGTTYRILTVGTTNFTLIGASASTVGVIFTATGAGYGTGTATASGIIKYYGTDNTEYFMSGADYYLDLKSEPGRIVLAYGKTWPSTNLRPANGICVEYICGYGSTPSSVPQRAIQAMLLLIGHWYENREALSDKPLSSIPMAVDSILWQDRVF